MTPKITFEELPTDRFLNTRFRANIITDIMDHHGTGKTQADALANAALAWRYYEQQQEEVARAETCPKCKTGKLMTQNGGGVACNQPGCGYWFCY